MAEEITTMDELSDAIDSSFETFRDADAPSWDKCKEYMENKDIVTVTVDGVPAKGGVVATLEGLRGFIPASHLSLKHIDDLNEYLGKELEVRVIEADESNNRLILSARSVLKEKADGEKAAKLAALTAGTIVEGTVETIKPYGAFIKIDDDITGLVHVSQISHKRISSPAAVLKEGQSVKAKVLNTNDGKLSLSIKALDEDREKKHEEEIRNVKIPASEALTQNLGDLLKNIKL